jgi:hypothetical protein
MPVRTKANKMSHLCRSNNEHFDPSEYHACLRALIQIDFELAYLSLLTNKGLKPLSRWEKPLDEHGLGLLHEMDLLAKQVQRTVQTGEKVIETIFSRTPAYVGLYEESFKETRINKSVRTQRLEGFLFGYPPCCVDQYVHKPYAPNNLTKQDQEILFHWACRDCIITPVLLKAYKNVYDWLEHF